MNNYDLKDEVSDKFSLRGRVFHKIREDTLNGKYGENEELKEAAIGEELGVSRTPVREAFRQLELDGADDTDCGDRVGQKAGRLQRPVGGRPGGPDSDYTE